VLDVSEALLRNSKFYDSKKQVWDLDPSKRRASRSLGSSLSTRRARDPIASVGPDAG